MKKRAALILALALLASLVVGVMPVSAASTYYYNITPVSSGAGYSFDIALAAGETILRDYSTAVVQVTGRHYNDGTSTTSAATATVIGITSGTTTVKVVNASGTVTKIYSVTVSTSSTSALTDVSTATVSISMKLSSYYTNVFTGERITFTAVVKDASNNVISPYSLRYSWAIDGTSGMSGTISTSSNGSVATVTLDTVPYSTFGTPIAISLIVYGANGSSKNVSFDSTTGTVYPYNTSTAITGGVKAYCGKVNYYYVDRDNSGVSISGTTIGTLNTFTNLPRTYYAPVGRALGMIRYMADATPRSVTFTPDILSYDIVAGVKKGTGSSSSSTSTGYGYLTLTNGYTIFESIESVNNLAVMKPGETQQITAAMLGGVPVNAPLMTYKIADSTVATVTSSGLITALKTGSTTLQVYCNGVQVIGKYLFVLNGSTETEEEEGLVIKPTSVTRNYAAQKNIRFRIKAANIKFNGVKVDYTDIEWSSSKTSVAIVDSNGYIRIKAKGTCYIYATYVDADGEEYTARLKVTVK